MVATRGWTEISATPAEELIDAMRERGVRTIVYTDIERDGMLTSPNFAAIESVAGLGVSVVASGGVATIDHVRRLAAIRGVDEAIIGRALYTGDMRLAPDEWVLRPAVSEGAPA
jgi:phosphoribosylformimino-5-aminoimidazole carboxamide ribotide isomerase